MYNTGSSWRPISNVRFREWTFTNVRAWTFINIVHYRSRSFIIVHDRSLSFTIVHYRSRSFIIVRDRLLSFECSVIIRMAGYKNYRKPSSDILRAVGGKIGKPKHSNVKIHLLGGISRKGLSPLVLFKGIMRSPDFQHYMTGLGICNFANYLNKIQIV